MCDGVCATLPHDVVCERGRGDDRQEDRQKDLGQIDPFSAPVVMGSESATATAVRTALAKETETAKETGTAAAPHRTLGTLLNNRAHFA